MSLKPVTTPSTYNSDGYYLDSSDSKDTSSYLDSNGYPVDSDKPTFTSSSSTNTFSSAGSISPLHRDDSVSIASCSSTSISTSDELSEASSGEVATAVKTTRYIDTQLVEGPEKSYIPPTEADLRRKEAQIGALDITQRTRMNLYSSFSRTPKSYSPSPLCLSWANDVLSTLVSHFNPESFVTLGNGANTTAYAMGSAGKKQVVRLFPYFQLSHKKLAPQYRLTRNTVGGEWLSAKVSGKHLASNSHLIVWNPRDNTFKVLDQRQANALIDSRQRMKEGEELYVVGTIGDYVEGSQDLSRILNNSRPLPEARACKITKKILKGIRELNQQRIIYRDLKPENVIVFPNGQIKLIDFGTSALHAQKKLPVMGDLCVHPYESFSLDRSGRTGLKTDSYGAHLIAYQLLTGESYHRGAKSTSRLRTLHYEARRRECETPLITSLAGDRKLQQVSVPMLHLMSLLGTSFAERRLTATEALKHPVFSEKTIVQIDAAA